MYILFQAFYLNIYFFFRISHVDLPKKINTKGTKIYIGNKKSSKNRFTVSSGQPYCLLFSEVNLDISPHEFFPHLHKHYGATVGEFHGWCQYFFQSDASTNKDRDENIEFIFTKDCAGIARRGSFGMLIVFLCSCRVC